MNTLFSYPIFLPMPVDDTTSNIPDEVLIKVSLATFIVTTVTWIIVFIIAIIHSAIISNEYEKEKFYNREYFFFTSLLCGFMDGIILFIGLIGWVFTLL